MLTLTPDYPLYVPTALPYRLWDLKSGAWKATLEECTEPAMGPFARMDMSKENRGVPSFLAAAADVKWVGKEALSGREEKHARSNNPSPFGCTYQHIACMRPC